MATWNDVQPQNALKLKGTLGVRGVPLINATIVIQTPFTQILDAYVEQVHNGQLTPDQYYAMLDNFSVIVEKYRGAKL